LFQLLVTDGLIDAGSSARKMRLKCPVQAVPSRRMTLQKKEPRKIGTFGGSILPVFWFLIIIPKHALLLWNPKCYFSKHPHVSTTGPCSRPSGCANIYSCTEYLMHAHSILSNMCTPVGQALQVMPDSGHPPAPSAPPVPLQSHH